MTMMINLEAMLKKAFKALSKDDIHQRFISDHDFDTSNHWQYC